MNNKPVAWMFEKDGAYMCIKHDNKVNYDGGIPLYTHLAKTLTDEEIDNAITEAFNRGARFGYAEGLKKASEK